MHTLAYRTKHVHVLQELAQRRHAPGRASQPGFSLGNDSGDDSVLHALPVQKRPRPRCGCAHGRAGVDVKRTRPSRLRPRTVVVTLVQVPAAALVVVRGHDPVDAVVDGGDPAALTFKLLGVKAHRCVDRVQARLAVVEPNRVTNDVPVGERPLCRRPGFDVPEVDGAVQARDGCWRCATGGRRRRGRGGRRRRGRAVHQLLKPQVYSDGVDADARQLAGRKLVQHGLHSWSVGLEQFGQFLAEHEPVGQRLHVTAGEVHVVRDEARSRYKRHGLLLRGQQRLVGVGQEVVTQLHGPAQLPVQCL